MRVPRYPNAALVGFCLVLILFLMIVGLIRSGVDAGQRKLDARIEVQD